MNKLKEKLSASVVSVLLSGAVLFVFLAQLLVGNNSPKDSNLAGALLGRNCSTNGAASTSPVTLSSAGAATSTVDCFLGGSNVLRVNAWLIASSTDTHYRFLVARSNDNKDFYQEGGSLLTLNANATTTQLNSFTELGIKFASSTKETQVNVNFGGTGTTSAKLITFEIPTRGANYVRVSTYLQTSKIWGVATTSDGGMLWMEGVPERE